MDLSTVLLVCAVVAGLAGGSSARFRSWGTSPSDLGVGFLVGALIGVLAGVVLILAADLDLFGIVHLLYLLLVVGVPIACVIIVTPHLVNREFRTPVVAWILLVLAPVLAGVGWWGTHVAPTRLAVEQVGLGATGASRPVVIGVIADLQTTTVGDYERRAITEVIEAEPDIVVMPGDLYQFPDEDFDQRAPEFVGLLRTLTDAVETVVLVEGNVDVPDGVEAIAETAGAIFLQDQILDISLDGQAMSIVGLTVSLDGDRRAIDPLLTEQLETSYDEDDLVILLSHYPDSVLSLADDAPIDLVISGHSHGGQVSLPGVGPLVTFTDVPRRVAAGGLHLVNGHPIYVSTGVGLERGQAPQLRFGVRPSVGIVTIVPN